MGPTLPPTNLDVLLLMGRVPGSSGVAASRYEFIFRSIGGSSLFLYLVPVEMRISTRGEAVRYFLSLVGDDKYENSTGNSTDIWVTVRA